MAVIEYLGIIYAACFLVMTPTLKTFYTVIPHNLTILALDWFAPYFSYFGEGWWDPRLI